MSFDIRKAPLTTISGILVVITYCSFTFTSWIFFPYTYGPLTDYLSRLGDFTDSPFGAYFYNVGCILTGIILIPFFYSLRVWYTKRKPQVFLLGTGQIFGVFSAVALIFIGIFSEDKGQPHITASSIFFILNFIVLIIVNLALLWNSSFFKPIALYAFIIDFLSLLLESSLGGPIVEWFTVFAALLFVALLSVNALRLTNLEQTEI